MGSYPSITRNICGVLNDYRQHRVLVGLLGSQRRLPCDGMPIRAGFAGGFDYHLAGCHGDLPPAAKRVGQSHAVAFLDRHSVSAFSLSSLDDRHLPRMAELMRQYAGLPMDLADASLVVLAEQLGPA